MLSVIGILMIVTCFALVLSKKVHMIIPFIIVPLIFAVFTGASLSEISKYVVEGVASTNNAVMLILFSVAYFSILSETGMFDIIVGKITKLTGNNVLVVMLATILIAMVGHLDGAYNTTYLITIPTLLPIYKALKIDKRILMFLTVMGATAMCAVPWGALVVQLTPFAEVEAMEISSRLLPYAILAFAMALVWAVLLSMDHKRKHAGEAALAEVAAGGTPDFTGKEFARPQYFWINFAIFVVSILCLFLVKIQTYILFMIFTALTLVVNYHDVKLQNQLIRKHSATMLAPALLFMCIGVMVGIMKGTGMVEAVIDVVLKAIPTSMTRYTHIIFGLLLVPIYIVLPYQVMLPIYPILTGIAASVGIAPVAVMLPFVLQYGTACSPLVAATNLGAELAEVNVIEHMKFASWRCWICSAILILAMCATGIVFAAA